MSIFGWYDGGVDIRLLKDPGTRGNSSNLGDAIVARSIDGQPRRAIFVLGTPVKEDAGGRVAWAVEMIRAGRESWIVVLGTGEEAGYMEGVALEHGLPARKLIVDGNSNSTVDNAYFAKRICRRLNLSPDVLVTSQYQMSRAAMTFRWVFGPECKLRLSPSLSVTSTTRRFRETVLRGIFPFFFLFRKGDDEGLKRGSDLLRRLFLRRKR